MQSDIAVFRADALVYTKNRMEDLDENSNFLSQ